MNRYIKVIFVFVFAGCILAYTNLFNRSFLLTGYCRNATEKGITVVSNSMDVCRGANLRQCIPPLMRFKQLYRTAKTHNLAACVIEKSFSTFLTAIMCFLHDPEGFKKSNRTLDSDIYGERLCKDKNEFTELKRIGDWQKYQLFAVVRNPIDRFVSGFTDKCLREKVWKKFKRRCAECKTNITCFVNKMYDRMARFSRSPYRGLDFDDSHFFPQSWRCEFSTSLVKYRVFQLDSPRFFDEMLGMFENKSVLPEAISFINESLYVRTPHSTLDSVERAAVEETILKSPALLRKVVQMYFFDFLIFGYPIPNIPSMP